MLNYPPTQTAAGRPTSSRDSASAVTAPEHESIVDDALRQLRSSAYCQVRKLSCEHREGALILNGQVSSWYQKQLAQEAIRQLPGVGVIFNFVKVVASTDHASCDVTEGST